jgi:hypothetical protein
VKKVKDTHPPQRSVRIKTASDINRLLAKVINDLIRNKIGENKAGKIGYLANIMLHSFETQEFEKRLEALEEIVRQEKKDEK